MAKNMTSNSADRPAQIEITEEMIEAGVEEIRSNLESMDAISIGGPRRLASDVFEAMRKVQINGCHKYGSICNKTPEIIA